MLHKAEVELNVGFLAKENFFKSLSSELCPLVRK